MAEYVPGCTQTSWSLGSVCSQDAVGGLRYKGVIRWYCAEDYAHWKGIYDDLEFEYEEVGIDQAEPPEIEPVPA